MCAPQGWRDLGLEEAPHYLEDDGKVKVPQKWEHMLKKLREDVYGTKGPRSGSPQPNGNGRA